MIRYLLTPDFNNTLLKIYHKSNKIMIPFLLPSLLLSNENQYKKYFDIFNIINLDFHSYFSFSTIITDYYKKIPFINVSLLRILNFKTHIVLGSYFLYNVYNYYYRPNLFKFKELKRRESLPSNI